MSLSVARPQSQKLVDQSLTFVTCGVHTWSTFSNLGGRAVHVHITCTAYCKGLYGLIGNFHETKKSFVRTPVPPPPPLTYQHFSKRTFP